MPVITLPQVFLSYRGQQLRYSFISHLTGAFERHGFKFFQDKDEQRGKSLTNLFFRIQESRIALVIFSDRYGESKWCLDELVKIKKVAEKGKLEVIPIFYNVKAREVRGQSGEFGDKFWTLAKTSSGDEIKKWKDALECISNKMGLSLGPKRYKNLAVLKQISSRKSSRRLKELQPQLKEMREEKREKDDEYVRTQGHGQTSTFQTFTWVLHSSASQDNRIIEKMLIQAGFYQLWVERNAQIHGKTPCQLPQIIAAIHTHMRNKLLPYSFNPITSRSPKPLLQLWFRTYQTTPNPPPLSMLQSQD